MTGRAWSIGDAVGYEFAAPPGHPVSFLLERGRVCHVEARWVEVEWIATGARAKFGEVAGAWGPLSALVLAHG